MISIIIREARLAKEWRRFLGGIPTRSQSLDTDEVLFRAGDAARTIFHVERGCLRLGSFQRARRGELVGEYALFLPAYPCDAVALAPSRVEIFPKALVLLHLSAHPQIALAFSAYLAGQVGALRGRLELLGLKSADRRVVAYLTRLGADRDTIRLERPLVTVAEEIGLTHEALYRALATLVKDGRLIRPGRRLFRLV